jgi:hypothetical protein
MFGMGKDVARALIICTVSVILIVVSACGGPKVDVSIYMIPRNGVSHDILDKLKAQLDMYLGEQFTIDLNGSPIYNPEKLMVEVAAGDHSILIVSRDDFVVYASNGVVPLEGVFDQEKYPDGVTDYVETKFKNGEYIEVARETHLYGLPVHESRWFKDAEISSKDELYAMLLPRGNIEQGMELLKMIMGEEALLK